MKISRKLPRTVIVAGIVTMMLAAGTGTALAKGAPVSTATPSPTATPSDLVSYTKVTFYKDGRKVTEEVPTDSLGLVTPDSGLTLGGACILDFSKFTGLGSLAAEANDGASLKDLFLNQFEGFFVPFSDWITYLRHLQVTHPKHHTKPNAANEQQTLLPGHAGADEHCGNDGEQCCHLASQHGYSPFPSGSPEQQGARWNGSLLLSVARVARELWPGFAWKPDQHFPVSELQVASTLTCIKPCCRL